MAGGLFFCTVFAININKNQSLEIKAVKFYDGGQLQEYCNNNAFDIVVLEMELDGDSGGEIAKNLKKINPNCIIIYISYR